MALLLQVWSRQGYANYFYLDHAGLAPTQARALSSRHKALRKSGFIIMPDLLHHRAAATRTAQRPTSSPTRSSGWRRPASVSLATKASGELLLELKPALANVTPPKLTVPEKPPADTRHRPRRRPWISCWCHCRPPHKVRPFAGAERGPAKRPAAATLPGTGTVR